MIPSMRFLIVCLLYSAAAALEREVRVSVEESRTDSDGRLFMFPLERGRDLKGSKGGASKGGSKGSEDCVQMWVWFNEDEFKKSFQGEGLLGTNEADLYNQRTGNKIGQYQEVTTGIGPKDCYSSGVYTVEYDQGRPKSQIFTASTCYARSQAIVGGTGIFACAKGTVSLTNAGAKARDNRMISACNLGCTE
jgi:hypothetical protein